MQDFFLSSHHCLKIVLERSSLFCHGHILLFTIGTCKPPGHTYDGPYVDAPGGYYIEIWDHLVLLLSVAVVRLREPFVA
ncbi:hypothetical protein Y032_0167g130 [Ancylostoma ceylanicum]|nr:hypothetical protein Y032_0167g130 [Ancylostoma ceylanicum]